MKIEVTDKWPVVLCIQLKKWNETSVTGVYVNEPRDMQIPLILSDFHGGPDTAYSLYSAIIHSGDAGSGHYATLFRPDPSGPWMMANDSIVEVYTENVQATLKQAFVLFYLKAR